MTLTGQSYFIKTFGCQMNEHDSLKIKAQFEGIGLTESKEAEAANVIIFNTCCIRENADNKLYGQLSRLKPIKEKRGDLKIVVAGCLAQKEREKILKNAPFVDVVVGTFNFGRIPALLGQAEDSPIVEIMDPKEEFDFATYDGFAPSTKNSFSSLVTIQVGCNNSCAFCVVPSVRGKEVSRPVGQVLAEVRELVKMGVKEVTLLGQNVNSYGRDITLNLRKKGQKADISYLAGEIYQAQYASNKGRIRPLFADLLYLLSDTGIRRIRFTSPHPKDLNLDVINAMAELPSVCKHLHLPLQSGSDRILSLMRRGYNSKTYLNKLELARSRIDKLAVSTDIIVGFPSETEEDFEDTLRVAAYASYDNAYTFIFSSRENTRASEMVDDFIDYDICVDRITRLKAVTDRSSYLNNLSTIGNSYEVFVEGTSKKDLSLFTGRTDQNKLIHFRTEFDLAAGSEALVKVTEAYTHYLKGELTKLKSQEKNLRLRVKVG